MRRDMLYVMLHITHQVTHHVMRCAPRPPLFDPAALASALSRGAT